MVSSASSRSVLQPRLGLVFGVGNWGVRIRGVKVGLGLKEGVKDELMVETVQRAHRFVVAAEARTGFKGQGFGFGAHR